MILVVAPEPAPWLATVLEAFDGRDVELVAPWAMDAPPVPIPRLTRYASRRRAPAGPTVRRFAPWPLIELGVRLWARGRVDRGYRAAFAIREAVDAWAARRVRAGVDVVVAPSLAAERTLAAAGPVGARRVLVEDLPSLRQLHADLDRAAAVHPDCAFLRRFRAPARVVARQEVERTLADGLLVRGHFARSLRLDEGWDASAVATPLPAEVARGGRSGGRTVLLAGVAAARHGSVEAALAAQRVGAQLLVRCAEVVEPGWLSARPEVRPVRDDELRTLDGVDAVVAPAWCESYPREVGAALAAGVPVVATGRAAGPHGGFLPVKPGDVDDLVARLTEAFGGRDGPPAPATPVWQDVLGAGDALPPEHRFVSV